MGLIDLVEGCIVLHKVLAFSKEDDALLLVAWGDVELLLDDGEDLADLEGGGHEEPIFT